MRRRCLPGLLLALLLLLLRAGPAGAALGCPPDGSFGCNAVISGTTVGRPAAASAYACPGEWPLLGPETAYSFSLAAPARVGILLDDSADPWLELVLLSACDETRCLRRHGQLILEDLPAGDYVLVVDSVQADGAPFSLLVACDAALEPAVARFSGAPGDCFPEAKTAWLTPEVPRADVLLSMDVTGSMWEEVAALQAQLPALMSFVEQWVQDAAFGIASFGDYYSPLVGMGECWYSGPNYGYDSDYPYRLGHPISTDRASVQAALDALLLVDGLDHPECYTRALHEAHADAAVGWRPGARRVLVTFGDAIMHDCNPLECLGDVVTIPKGIDFGRDSTPDTADDLRLLPTVDALAAAGVTWLHVESSGGMIEQAGDGSRGYGYDEIYGCLTARTGGGVTEILADGTPRDGRSLSDFVGTFVRDGIARCDDLRLAAEPGWEAWLTDAGAVHADVMLPATRAFDIVTCIPPGTPAGTYAFEVLLLCDGTPVASQRVEVAVGDEQPCAPPAPFTARAEDLSSCSSGVLVSWDPIAWPEPARPGVIHVRRSPSDCADAARLPPVALSLPGNATSWIDSTSPGGGAALSYVVEAEAPGAAAGCLDLGHLGGAATRACVAPPVIDVGDDPFPGGVGAVLRLRHDGQDVTIDWTRARALAGREHFHLLKGADHPTRPFARVNPEGDSARSRSETDGSSPLQFFDLRVANGCEEQSLDEFPPGWDVDR